MTFGRVADDDSADEGVAWLQRHAQPLGVAVRQANHCAFMKYRVIRDLIGE